ncbi:MAG: ribbon-helix-helix domain-containing protein [archaeon]|nr:ribbon-helix-helix domain-containing protein [archaeon]
MYNILMFDAKQDFKAKSVGVKLAPIEYRKIRRMVKEGAFLNVSDFIREAIREKLEGTEVIYLRDVDYETAKKEILEYYQHHKEAYYDEIANDLRLDLEMTVKIVNELVREKKVEVVG